MSTDSFILKNKRLLLGGILFLLLLPLLFINIKPAPTWGGDFAQYIHQANNYCNGKSPDFQYYIFNENYADLAPSVYPVGFPMILAPLVCKYGIDYPILNRFMAFLAILLVVSWYVFLSRYFSPILSFIISLLIGYSPWLLSFKSNVLSDIYFAILICWVLILATSRENKLYFLKLLLMGVVLGIALITKTATVAIIGPLILYFAYRIFLSHSQSNVIKRLLLHVFPFLVGFSIYYINSISHQGAEHIGHFQQLLHFDHLLETIMLQLSYYYQTTINFYTAWAKPYALFNSIWSHSIALIILFGLYKAIKRQQYVFYLICLASFLAMLVLFPYHQGYRYFLPMTPIIILFFAYGLKHIPFSLRRKKQFFGVLIVLAYLLPLRVNLVGLAKELDQELSYGPESKDATEMFNYIRDTPANAVIMFVKPRVMGLYTERKSVCNSLDAKPDFIHDEVRNFGVNYLVRTSIENNIGLDNYIDEYPHMLSLVFENESFKVYQIK